MQNRVRYILASFLSCAALCALNSTFAFNDGLFSDAGFGIRVAYSQDEDPFGGDTEENPFASYEEDPFDTTASAAADEDSQNPFADAPDPSAPFAPSSLSPLVTPTIPGPAAADDELSEEEQARAEERAKYSRAEDVPDELKTEADFYETANAAELSVLRVTPTNDAEWFCAAVRVARVGRPSFARLLVAKAADAPVATPEESAKGLDSLGSGRAIYFVGNPEIGPIGAEVYEKILASARQYWESDAALRDAFSRAASGSVSERAQGITDARKGGLSALKLLIGDLVSGSVESQLAAAELLPFFEEDAISALIACVRSASEEQLPPAAKALGDFADLRVGPELAARYYLVDPESESKDALQAALDQQYPTIPSAEEFAKLAYDKALGYYRGLTTLPGVVDGQAGVWEWDAQSGTLTRAEVPVSAILREEAAHWALVAYHVGQSVDAAPTGVLDLAIAAVAEQNAHRVGLDVAHLGIDGFNLELPNLSVEELVSGLKYALDTEHYSGALIPTIILRDLGDETLCYGSSGPSPIVQAATCPDRRERYHALAAIVHWNPSKPYPGSSRIPPGLEWFASASGERVVVVAAPRLATASQIGQSFAPLGYRIIPATTGREALLAAQQDADVEFVFATSEISSPNISILAQALRSDVRTSDVPLLVGTETSSAATAANVLAGREQNVVILPVPRESDGASWAIQKLTDSADIMPVDPQARMRWAQATSRALLQLLTTRPSIYEFDGVNEFIRKLLSTPALFDQGLEFAAAIKTPYAQKALVELAGDTRFGIDVRSRAVAAFERQLAENGSLLRGPDVVAMYDRYNASENEDVQTQQVLSRLLDVYEAATQER